MNKITIEIEDDEEAKVVVRQLPQFLAFCRATHEEEQGRDIIPNQAAQPGCNKIH
ncbi:hypothetical protein ACEUBT_08405 [Aeromonas bivalvium]|uniref:hypothetical protein n=1 Tax=Aeromonas bivalvium TaxID=440079 RepID=UPI0038D12AFD